MITCGLRHSSTTMEIYSHVGTELQEDAASAMDALLRLDA